MGTSSSQNGDGDEGCAEEDVQENGQEGEDCDASKEKCEDYGKPSVDDGSARQALNCLFPFWDRIMA